MSSVYDCHQTRPVMKSAGSISWNVPVCFDLEPKNGFFVLIARLGAESFQTSVTNFEITTVDERKRGWSDVPCETRALIDLLSHDSHTIVFCKASLREPINDYCSVQQPPIAYQKCKASSVQCSQIQLCPKIVISKIVMMRISSTLRWTTRTLISTSPVFPMRR